jgi:hypothetical protein
MPTDPWLDGAAIVDPDLKRNTDQAALTRRVSALERQSTVQTGSGPPSAPARDGTLYVDITNSRLYARTAGVWKSAALT